jgi:SAM-dependent methyltransferase
VAFNRSHIFNRSGLAALSDLETQDWKELFDFLEKEQTAFLKKEREFRSQEYKWPHDALHWWSRVWEYPYVYYHLKVWRDGLGNFKLPRVVDVGSGVTFFPFSVARLGCHVICTDIDYICSKDLRRAAQCVPHDPGTVEFRQTDGSTLPFADGEVDAVYCISVLEHIPKFETMIEEFARILTCAGLLLLTIDRGLNGNSELGMESYKRLSERILQHFNYLHPEVTIHPADILYSTSGPYALEKPKGFELPKFLLKEHFAKPLLGRKPSPLRPHLAVQGFALKKFY